MTTTMNSEWLMEWTRDVLDMPVKSGYRVFWELCLDAGADMHEVSTSTALAMDVMTPGRKHGRIHPLELRWYDSLAAGNPDYGIYDGDDYLGYAWESWVNCSRKYLKLLQKSHTLDHLPAGARVLDPGNGFGFTTVTLAQMLPQCDIVATNLETSKQTAMARQLGNLYDFTVLTSLGHLAAPIDVVFASEYFEHFQEPIKHLNEVLDTGAWMLIVANTFTHASAGHFDSSGYLADGKVLHGGAVSRAFNSCLRQRGFVKQDTGFWNNRPMVWLKR